MVVVCPNHPPSNCLQPSGCRCQRSPRLAQEASPSRLGVGGAQVRCAWAHTHTRTRTCTSMNSYTFAKVSAARTLSRTHTRKLCPHIYTQTYTCAYTLGYQQAHLGRFLPISPKNFFARSVKGWEVSRRLYRLGNEACATLKLTPRGNLSECVWVERGLCVGRGFWVQV